MERNRIAALTAIALMLIVPITLMLPGAEADEEPYLPTSFPTFGYKLSMVSEQVSSVEVYSESSEGTPEIKNGLDDWDFTSGMGPFNSFYAAINLSQSIEGCSEPRIGTSPGQVAYILDPNDLSRTLRGNAFTGEYNIMLVIPTVYWYADGDVLYLSNDPDFFGADTEVDGHQQMTAYAHTVTDPAGGSATTYDFLCLGVYEASEMAIDGKSTLVSVSGAAPRTGLVLHEFRDMVVNNISHSDGVFGLWNFYHWTLYKMMSYTVMCGNDSKSLVGNGVVRKYGNPISTGTMDGKGWYYGDKRVRDNGSKLFIENSWGNLWEYLDNTYIGRSGKLYAGDGLGDGINIAYESNPNQTTELSGTDHVDGQYEVAQTGRFAVTNYTTSKASPVWNLPADYSGYHPTHPSRDIISADPSSTYATTIIVGGSKWWVTTNGSNLYGGLSTLVAVHPPPHNAPMGARLAYVMNLDSMELFRIGYDVAGDGYVSGPELSRVGTVVELSADCDEGHRLTILSYSYETASGTNGGPILDEMAFTMPACQVVVHAVFEPTVLISVVSAPPGGNITVDPGVQSFRVLLGSTYTVHGYAMTVTDRDGSAYRLTACGDPGYYLYSFIDGDYNLMEQGCLGSDSVISASFVTWIPLYKVEFYESPSRITELFVKNGADVLMP